MRVAPSSTTVAVMVPEERVKALTMRPSESVPKVFLTTDADMDGCWDVVWGGVEAVEMLLSFFFSFFFLSFFKLKMLKTSIKI